MKILLRWAITHLLAWRARRLLKRYRTQVIAVTGSIGKTSTKEALYTILKNHFKTYRGANGFNTDLGVSLAILQEEESGFSSAWQWANILFRAFFGIKEHYQKIVLEFGADHPGDIKRLVRVAKPKIGIVTNVNPVHLDLEKGQFENIEAIAKEKNTLIKTMHVSDLAILNYDDPWIRSMQTNAQKIYYGTDEAAHLYASNVRVGLKGIHFMAHYKNTKATFTVPVVGRFQLGVLLPAIAASLQLGISLEDCAKNLQAFRLPPGRMNLLPGLNKSYIVDASYNASPVAMKRALEVLQELPGERKIAALGTMNELGKLNDEAHVETGTQAGQFVDILIAVGASAHLYKRGAVVAGMKDSAVYTFLDSEEAGYFVQKLLRPKDLILVKGSQNRIRMERFTKLIMAYPKTAEQVLCRQGESWQMT